MYSKSMATFLALLTFFSVTLYPKTIEAAYAPAAPTMTIGGRQFTDLTNLIVLACYLGSGDSCTMRKTTSGSGYQVTNGKTFVATAIEFHNKSASAGACLPVYADNDIGMAGASSSFTNPVYLDGTNASTEFFTAQPVSSAANNGVSSYAFYWTVPAAKYPAIRCNSAFTNGSIWMYGYEQ